MLTRLIDLCLRYRPIVLLATAVLALVGLLSLARLPFDAFPDTTVGVVRSFSGKPEDLEPFCRKYWKPMYAYLRASCTRKNEDAKDLTQAFFVWLMEEGRLERYDPQRGRLRGYLKVLLKRFVGHHDVAQGRLKRGGGANAAE